LSERHLSSANFYANFSNPAYASLSVSDKIKLYLLIFSIQDHQEKNHCILIKNRVAHPLNISCMPRDQESQYLYRSKILQFSLPYHLLAELEYSSILNLYDKNDGHEFCRLVAIDSII